MLAILDPVLFDPAAPLSPVTLKDLLRLLSHKHAHIPGVDWYWKELQRQLIRPLHARPGYQDLDRLRDFARTVGFPPLPRRVSVWSFRQMFGALSESWVETMARLVTALRVQPAGGALCRIPVVCRERNLDVPWTCRFDDRLPAREDDAAFPFCPPPDWHRASVTAVTTHESRPTCRDHKGNHWARPATGEGHHWDVYLTQALEEEYGLGQLNITRWGAPEREGAPGSLHHVPKDKQARLHKKTGWSC